MTLSPLRESFTCESSFMNHFTVEIANGDGDSIMLLMKSKGDLSVITIFRTVAFMKLIENIMTIATGSQTLHVLDVLGDREHKWFPTCLQFANVNPYIPNFDNFPLKNFIFLQMEKELLNEFE